MYCSFFSAIGVVVSARGSLAHAQWKGEAKATKVSALYSEGRVRDGEGVGRGRERRAAMEATTEDDDDESKEN